MEPLNEAMELLKRQAELDSGLRHAGGIRITEREIYALRERLQRYPRAATAILLAARPSTGRSIRCKRKTSGNWDRH